MTEDQAALREAMLRIKELEERLRRLEARVAASTQVAQLIMPGSTR